MEIKQHERGPFKGRIDLPRSMETMAIGESWRIPEGTINLRTVRNVCSVLSRTTNKVFSSRCPGLTERYITIRRIR